jgi:hypothetical protein
MDVSFDFEFLWRKKRRQTTAGEVLRLSMEGESGRPLYEEC